MCEQLAVACSGMEREVAVGFAVDSPGHMGFRVSTSRNRRVKADRTIRGRGGDWVMVFNPLDFSRLVRVGISSRFLLLQVTVGTVFMYESVGICW